MVWLSEDRGAIGWRKTVASTVRLFASFRKIAVHNGDFQWINCCQVKHLFYDITPGSKDIFTSGIVLRPLLLLLERPRITPGDCSGSWKRQSDMVIHRGGWRVVLTDKAEDISVLSFPVMQCRKPELPGSIFRSFKRVLRAYVNEPAPARCPDEGKSAVPVNISN